MPTWIRWFKEKTQGKIDRIRDAVDPDTAPVLLNAVYLKAAWNSAFAKSATQEVDFHLSASRRVAVSMMRQQAFFRVAQRTDYRTIRLDDAERSLGMIIILPNVNADELANLVGELKNAPHSPARRPLMPTWCHRLKRLE